MKNYIKITLISLLLIYPSIIEAKKSSSSSNSSRSYSSSKSKSSYSSKNSFSSSYNKIKSKKLEKAKSSKSYKDYKATTDKFKNKTTPIDNNQLKSIRNRDIEPQKYYDMKEKYYQNNHVSNYAYNYSSNFGVWDAIFLWNMLDKSPKESAKFVYHHSNDSGIRSWLNIVQYESTNNNKLKNKLNQLNHELNILKRKNPRINNDYIPSYLPNSAIAYSASAFLPSNSSYGYSSSSNSFSIIWDIVVPVILLLLIIGVRKMYLKLKDLIKSFLDKINQKDENKEEDNRQNINKNNFPLNLWFNSLIEIEGIDRKFILSSNSLIFPKMNSNRVRIASISKINVDEELTTYRAYLKPEFSEDDYIYFIEIESKDSEVIGVKIFGKIDEIFPETEKEWSSYLDETSNQTPYIGSSTLTIDNIEFQRVFEQNSNQISQYKFDEIFYSNGNSKEILKNISSLYGRNINNTLDEYLFITAIEEENGDAYIEVYAGLELRVADLKIT